MDFKARIGGHQDDNVPPTPRQQVDRAAQRLAAKRSKMRRVHLVRHSEGQVIGLVGLDVWLYVLLLLLLPLRLRLLLCLRLCWW